MAFAVASVPRHVASRLTVYAAPVVVMHEKLELDARPPVAYLFLFRGSTPTIFFAGVCRGRGPSIGSARDEGAPSGMKGAPSGMKGAPSG